MEGVSVYSAGPRFRLCTQMNVYIVPFMLTSFIYSVKSSDATNSSGAVDTAIAPVNFKKGGAVVVLA